MSELIHTHNSRATIRWKLLTSASALALVAYVSSGPVAKAEDGDHPLIWLEIGGQFNRIEDAQEIFAPTIFSNRPAIFSPSQGFETPPRYDFDEYGRLSFQPEDSSWVLSASIRYGRSASHKQVHQQTNPKPFYKYFPCGTKICKSNFDAIGARFADTTSGVSEQHAILDFQAGKDVGLGMFGSKDATSVVSLGVRFAQFKSRSNIAIKSDPDWHFNLVHYYGKTYVFGQPFHSNDANLTARQIFHGVGPSISWNASAPIAGNLQDGAIAVDWSVNAALLFGKQRTKVHHRTTGRYHSKYNTRLPETKPLSVTYQPTPFNKTRSRSITVPDVGGTVGLSYRYADAKLSLGYRADVFFNAIDGGIDTAKKENRAFYGPYASISVGLGD